MVSIVTLIMTPVVLGAIIYGATMMFSKHPIEPHKDASNVIDLLNATSHTAELHEIVRTTLASDEAAQYVDVFSGLTAPDPTVASNPKATFDVVPATMNLLKPLVFNLRADIRNTLIWLCQGEPGSTIEGRASADDAAKQALADDQAAIALPNGTIYFMDLFDSHLGSMALDCVKGHSSSVLKGMADQFWERLDS